MACGPACRRHTLCPRINSRRFPLSLVTIVLLVVGVLLLLLMLGAVSGRRRSVVGGETVSTGGGSGAGLLLGIVAIIVLIVVFFGFWQWNWFGTQSGGSTQNPAISSPAAPSGGGSQASPSASPS